VNEDQSALEFQQGVIPSTPFKPEVEARMKQIMESSHVDELDHIVRQVLQESQLNDVCNEVYIELLTQEFNPDQEEDDGQANGISILLVEELELVLSKGILR
jgi:hypothetical protein